MTDLSFAVVDLAPEPYAVSPILTVRLRIDDSSGEPIHAIALRAQVRIEPQLRRHSQAEAEALADMFGPRERWTDTLRSFLWMQASTLVQGFTGSTEVDLPLSCTYDFEVTASKYLHALRDGAVPMVLLFTGTVFTKGTAGFGVEQIPWDKEVRYEMPVRVWRDLVAQNFPATGWLRLDHDVLGTLAAYKASHGLTTSEEAVTDLLARAQEVVP
ncbi:MAG: hypothetical protein QOF35_1852 [Actinomycetota bacterium]|jgi:hypothetical protein|nr:hypothetical protein [Actinomycetota bacterium]